MSSDTDKHREHDEEEFVNCQTYELNSLRFAKPMN